MARPLRLLVAGGWYHVVVRGNDRQALYRDDRDRQRFLGLVAELPERFRVEVHAFVLMDNHYHLLVRTLEANLSHAVRWLNVSYSVWFNWRHRRVGHLVQGRFKAAVVQDERGVCEVARYLHLNPVRVGRLGLGKAEVARQRTVAGVDPGRELVQRRLEVLRGYAWSSWRVYSGEEAAPGWLLTGVVEVGCGGRSRKERLEAVRAYTEDPVREGYVESPWTRLVGGLVLGEEQYARGLLGAGRTDREEQTAVRQLREKLSWERIVEATENARGRPWKELVDAHGEWGRDGALYFAVRHGGLRLAEVVRRIPGLKYMAAVQAVKRFAARLETEEEPKRFVARLKRQMSTV